MKYRLCVDDRWASAHGISRYSTELIARLENDFEIARIAQKCSIQDPASPWKLSAAIRRANADIFWSPGFVPPASSAIPSVFTLHDLTHVHARGGFHAAYFNFVIRPLCRKAHKIITVSEYSRAEICQWAKLQQEQVVVIPNGVAESYKPDGDCYNPGFPYIFYVGNHMPHKNLKRAFQGFAKSKLAGEYHFLLTGDPNPELMRVATDLRIHGQVQFIGKVPESELPSYYRGATATILLSTNEGFGLPVVESMASGVPVLAANSTSLPEVAGGAALLVDPLQVDGIAEGMRRIVTDTDLRESCLSKGLDQSRRFNWDKSAEKLSSVLCEAVDEN